ncbi:hypothetical protein PG993_010413 [Apiospora rasikravindrae]|uniref:Uncharacterized protein n=1 Tax=Apiospora rasikravindrae TaxID=990691 RepID=A0ABR1SPI3_9PEZI
MLDMYEKRWAQALTGDLLSLILDRILSHPFFRTNDRARPTFLRAFKHAGLGQEWQNFMAIVVQHLLERRLKEPLGTVMDKVLYMVRLAVKSNLEGPGASRDENYELLEKLVRGELQNEGDDENDQEVQEEDENYHLVELFEDEGKKRQML